MSLRGANQELRSSVFRGRRPRSAGSTGADTDAPSRQANLAVDYLDAFAPAVIAALHPIPWPRIVALDGVPLRVRADYPVPLAKPLPWTGERSKRWTPSLHAAMLAALRGPDERVAFLALVERHVPSDRLEPRSWIATNEPLIRCGWTIAQRHIRPAPSRVLSAKETAEALRIADIDASSWPRSAAI